MKHYQISVSGQTFDVRVLTDPLQEKVSVEVDGERFEVGVEARPDDAETVATTADAHSGATTAADAAVSDTQMAASGAPSRSNVTAPLPGVVKSIAVQPGQQLSVGDEILVIEAMKMDNAIRATREGVISAVHVSEGNRVAHGQLLIDYGE